MSATRRFVWLYIAGGLVFLLGLYLFRTSEIGHSTPTPNAQNSNVRTGTVLAQGPRPYLPESTSNSLRIISSQPRSDAPDSSPVADSRQNPSTASYTKSDMLTLRIPEQMTMSSIHFYQFLNVVND